MHQLPNKADIPCSSSDARLLFYRELQFESVAPIKSPSFPLTGPRHSLHFFFSFFSFFQFYTLIDEKLFKKDREETMYFYYHATFFRKSSITLCHNRKAEYLSSLLL